MRKTSAGLISSGIAALLLLAACGGGGGGGGGGGQNVAPSANAGAAQTVNAGAAVALNGTASSDSDGSIATYQWTQVGGTAVLLSSPTAAQPTFTAPQVAVVATLTFRLVVTDNAGASSAAATVMITVNPVTANPVQVTGVVRFTRVPFRITPPIRLDYPNPVLQPARGVIVRAVNATTQGVLATGETSATGGYSLTVPGNTSIVIQVVARMQRSSAQPLPNWDVRVQDGTAAGAAPYSWTSASFNSSVAPQNLDIPLGIDANGAAAGERASGPFAILDTIYLAIQTVLSVSPTVNLPALYVDWGAQHEGTFFTGSSGQHIALMSDLTEDTDEFDRHTIAHEYGHYIEANFSRSDSIGGPHAYGDRLDPRVAFGEGWGYAFAAIVLNDPLVLDSFVDNGTPVAGGFQVETNPPSPSGLSGPGCWCSETTVWSLLWDLYDSAPDGSDNVALGFAPIWSALTGAEKTTPSVTTIFSFIEAVKAVAPADAAAINTLVQAQNIDATSVNAFATTETHPPTDKLTGVPIPSQLPVFTPIVKGTPVVVTSIDDDGHYNKVGNHRLLRFTAPNAANFNVTVTTSNSDPNADPDFYVFRAGVVAGGSTGPPNGQHNDSATVGNVVSGADYILDVYDCANGCDDDQGTPGDYNLTVAIN